MSKARETVSFAQPKYAFPRIRRSDIKPRRIHTRTGPITPSRRASPEEIAEAKRRFDICKTCENARDGGFACTLHPGCCFGRWRGHAQNHCPAGKW